MLSAIQSLLVAVVALVSVSFYTLLERKLLGSAHLRLGPNILGWGGLLQPFADAIKLFAKEWFVPRASNVILFQLSPLLLLGVSLLLWVLYPLPSLLFSFKYLLLLFFSFTTFSSLSLMLSGWSSNSSYSLAGSLRGVAQTISYEVSLIFLFMIVMLLGMGLGLQNYQMQHSSFSWGWLVSPFLLLWLLSAIAEVNRTPFDFAEGESELVSGFNVEFGGFLFSVLFMAEYSALLFSGFLLSVMMFSSSVFSALPYVVVGSISFLFVWSRVTFPRFRYDKLMATCWELVLPVSILLLATIIGLRLYPLLHKALFLGMDLPGSPKPPTSETSPLQTKLSTTTFNFCK